MAKYLQIIFGILILALPLVPFSRFIPALNYDEYLNTPVVWLNGILIVSALAGLLTFLLGEKSEKIIRLSFTFISKYKLILFIFLPLFLYLLSGYLFNYKPLIVDGIAQAFQAQVFANGKLIAPPVQYSQFFMGQHLLFEPNGVYSQYPPGYSFILAPFVKLGAPWLADIFLSTISASLIYLGTKILFNEKMGVCSLLLLLVSPFYFCMGVASMNHILALTGTSLVYYCLANIWSGNKRVKIYLLLGIALGVLFITRPLSGMIIGVLTGSFLLSEFNFFKISLVGIFGGIISSLFFIFNYATTGDPFLPGYIKLWGVSHNLGFHQDPWGQTHTFIKGIALQGYNLFCLNEYLYESLVPSLYLIGIPLLLGRMINKTELKLTLFFLTFPLIYTFYWHQDTLYGPRFLYEGLPFLIPLLASINLSFIERLNKITFNLNRLFNLGVFWKNFLLVFFLLAIFSGIPNRLKIYHTGMDSMKVDLQKAAKSARITEGNIFISTSWGDRIISELRGCGVSADLVEQVYRKVDHCELWNIALECKNKMRAFEDIVIELSEKLKIKSILIKPGWNKDGSLRIDPLKTPTQECIDELEYDKLNDFGYTVYAPHLLSNQGDLDSKLLFVRDLRDDNKLIIERYSGRDNYVYRGGEFRKVE